MSSLATQRAGEDGFTLLEMVIATAIMAMAFAALYPIFAVVPARLVAARHHEEAVVTAASVLEEQVLLHVWTDLPATGESERWSWTIKEVPLTGLPSESIPGHPLHLEITLADRENGKDTVTLDQIVWAQD